MPLPAGLVGNLGGLLGAITSPATYPLYHVVVGGVGLILGPNGWERHLAPTFAAKLSTTGTSENDRLGEQQLLLSDWSGGEGLVRQQETVTTPLTRYRRGAGINVYDEDSILGLGPYMAAPAALQTAFNSITAMAV